ncbi:hypothetical protein SCUCBS95973_005688 [Sporothrix curviconia]|uniref:Uncharacterized protein n=1 Tax=Sporothrix curviconia TaxID=1260050 RepID=A0ABP0BYX4_9PEZI
MVQTRRQAAAKAAQPPPQQPQQPPPQQQQQQPQLQPPPPPPQQQQQIAPQPAARRPAPHAKILAVAQHVIAWKKGKKAELHQQPPLLLSELSSLLADLIDDMDNGGIWKKPSSDTWTKKGLLETLRLLEGEIRATSNPTGKKAKPRGAAGRKAAFFQKKLPATDNATIKKAESTVAKLMSTLAKLCRRLFLSPAKRRAEGKHFLHPRRSLFQGRSDSPGKLDKLDELHSPVKLHSPDKLDMDKTDMNKTDMDKTDKTGQGCNQHSPQQPCPNIPREQQLCCRLILSMLRLLWVV